MTITTATATRQGTGPNNADAADVFRSEHGDVAAAIVDIAGHHPDAPAVASLLAQTIVRVAPGKGGVAALLTAGLLTADAGDEPEPQPDGVAVCATARTDESTAVTWIGDCQAWAWNGHTLTRLTTPHTVGEQLRTLYGLTVDTTAAADDIITTHLGHATPATVMSTTTTDPVVVLTTDGADYLPPRRADATGSRARPRPPEPRLRHRQRDPGGRPRLPRRRHRHSHHQPPVAARPAGHTPAGRTGWTEIIR